MKTHLHLCAALASLVVLLSPATGDATTTYSFTHNADGYGSTGPIESVGPQNTPIDYSFSGVTYFTGANSSDVSAHVGPGSIGISSQTHNNGGYAVQRQEITARVQFDVLFESAASGTVSVAMNLLLSGMVDPTAYLYSTVIVEAGKTMGVGQHSSGQFSEIGIPTPSDPNPIRTGMLASFVDDGTEQSISTLPFEVELNQLTTLYIALSTIQPYATDDPSISFGDTLKLTTLGDIFTNPGGSSFTDITVNGDFISDNRLNTVPLPAALPLLAAGFGLLSLMGWRCTSTVSV
ncbi:MAG: hypothetical protein LJE67_02390 [Salaquimonas sp.]|nr:hypothetical protein [Salaquimonas sp.]